ncbi:MAG: GFA family protein [Devosia sp.]
MTSPETWKGQCHCGAVRFSVTTDLEGLADCNCSRCKRLGWVMKGVPESAFTLEAGEDRLVDYRFNTHAISHLFCRDCGIESFGRGQDGAGNTMVMINVNCLEGAPDIDRSAIKHWDGRNF